MCLQDEPVRAGGRTVAVLSSLDSWVNVCACANNNSAGVDLQLVVAVHQSLFELARVRYPQAVPVCTLHRVASRHMPECTLADKSPLHTLRNLTPAPLARA